MKRIAFIKDGVVTTVLNCEEDLLQVILNADAQIDATEADQLLTKNWAYDGTVFSAPE